MFLFWYVLIQIIAESLPISSSGHVALLKFFFPEYQLSDVWILDFLLHGPTIFILFLYFFRQWWCMLFDVPISFKALLRKSLWRSVFTMMLFVGVADGITFLVWWKKWIPQIPLTLGFVFTALLLYGSQFVLSKKRLDWNFYDACLLGLAQACALAPGISRFATTYSVGKFIGYNAQISFALSFLIQMPLIIGAFVKGLMALQGNRELVENLFDLRLLFVILSASFISYAALWFVGKIVKRENLWKFSWYMIIPIMLSVVL